MNQNPDIEKYLEIDREKEDKEKEARVPEDRGREALVLEVAMIVEEEEEVDKGKEATVQKVIGVEEEEGDMRREGVMLAMGAAEKFAQRP